MDLMTVAIGAHAAITLSGLGAAGYRWTAAVADPKIAAVQRDDAPAGEGRPRWGRSRDEIFVIVGLSVGETVVHFEQRRSFEPAQKPVATRDIIVRVSP